MKRALREPALQIAAGVAAFMAFAWPLLVFDRAVQVFVAFFVVWILIIALLFAFAWAQEEPAGHAPDEAEPELPDA
jgi:hypothetical protein